MAVRPPLITEPLIIPTKDSGIFWSPQLRQRHCDTLKELARWLGLRRPSGRITPELLLDAIINGQIALRRIDDPQSREFTATQSAISPANP
jgi:hypothetical protein